MRGIFGDGTTSTIVNPTKTYDEGGVYPVTLTVEDDSGLPGGVHIDRILVKVDELVGIGTAASPEPAPSNA